MGDIEERKCPACGKKVEIPVIKVIEAGNENALHNLFAGKLNCIACPECGKRILANVNLIYKDCSNPFIMYELPYPEDIQIEEIEQHIDEMATSVFMKENLPRPVVRLVFNRTDFIEKIAARRLGLDDRLLEYAKLQLFRTMEEPQLLQCRHKLHLDYSHCNDEYLTFLIYDTEESRFINALQVPMFEFRQMAEALEKSDELRLELETAFPGCYVTADRLM